MRRQPATVASLFRCVRIVLLDVDGTLTDGSIVLFPGGEELKIFDVKDGTAIVWAHWAGIPVVLITGRGSRVLEERARELRVAHLRQRVKDKVSAATEILDSLGLTFADAAAMGDDYGDITLLRRVALPTCPVDAAPEVAQICRWKSRCKGGHGAVRDLIERILRARNLMPVVRERYGL